MSEINVSVTDKIFGYIDALAAKLGVASEYVFTMLVRQKFAEGIVTLSLIGGFLILAVVFLAAGLIWAKKDRVHEDDPDTFHPAYLFIVVGAAIGIITLMGAGIEGKSAVMHVINPEYYALKEILDAIGGAR